MIEYQPSWERRQQISIFFNLLGSHVDLAGPPKVREPGSENFKGSHGQYARKAKVETNSANALLIQLTQLGVWDVFSYDCHHAKVFRTKCLPRCDLQPIVGPVSRWLDDHATSSTDPALQRAIVV